MQEDVYKRQERLGVPAVMMSDGPSGLRKQDEQGDHLGINESIPAVCFPSSAAVASKMCIRDSHCSGRERHRNGGFHAGPCPPVGWY